MIYCTTAKDMSEGRRELSGLLKCSTFTHDYFLLTAWNPKTRTHPLLTCFAQFEKIKPQFFRPVTPKIYGLLMQTCPKLLEKVRTKRTGHLPLAPHPTKFCEGCCCLCRMCPDFTHHWLHIVAIGLRHITNSLQT